MQRHLNPSGATRCWSGGDGGEISEVLNCHPAMSDAYKVERRRASDKLPGTTGADIILSADRDDGVRRGPDG